MKINSFHIFRFDVNNPQHVEFLWEKYNDARYADFFRRIPKDLSETSLKSIETITGAAFYPIYDSKGYLFALAETSGIDPYARSCDSGLLVDAKLFSDTLEGSLGEHVMREVIDFLFKSTPLNKVSLRFLSSNKNIQDSCVRNKMSLQGVFEDGIFYQGAWHNEYEYSITRKTFYERVS